MSVKHLKRKKKRNKNLIWETEKKGSFLHIAKSFRRYLNVLVFSFHHHHKAHFCTLLSATPSPLFATFNLRHSCLSERIRVCVWCFILWFQFTIFFPSRISFISSLFFYGVVARVTFSAARGSEPWPVKTLSHFSACARSHRFSLAKGSMIAMNNVVFFFNLK